MWNASKKVLKPWYDYGKTEYIDNGKVVSNRFERRVERNIKVRGAGGAGGAGGAESRPVVMMKMCIGESS